MPGAARTLLLYCHYDTKPAPPERLAPAVAVRADPPRRVADPEDGGHAIGRLAERGRRAAGYRLYARGASDDKGPIWAHLEALALMDALGIAPRVNLKLILEGEEEVGSPCFGAFVEAHRDLLAADLVARDGRAEGRERAAHGRVRRPGHPRAQLRSRARAATSTRGTSACRTRRGS